MSNEWGGVERRRVDRRAYRPEANPNAPLTAREFRHFKETIMATIADLTAALSAAHDAEADLDAHVQNLGAAVTELVAFCEGLKGRTVLTAEDQASLDNAVGMVTEATTDLAQRSADLATSEAAARAETSPPA